MYGGVNVKTTPAVTARALSVQVTLEETIRGSGDTADMQSMVWSFQGSRGGSERTYSVVTSVRGREGVSVGRILAAITKCFQDSIEKRILYKALLASAVSRTIQIRYSFTVNRIDSTTTQSKIERSVAFALRALFSDPKEGSFENPELRADVEISIPRSLSTASLRSDVSGLSMISGMSLAPSVRSMGSRRGSDVSIPGAVDSETEGAPVIPRIAVSLVERREGCGGSAGAAMGSVADEELTVAALRERIAAALALVPKRTVPTRE